MVGAGAGPAGEGTTGVGEGPFSSGSFVGTVAGAGVRFSAGAMVGSREISARKEPKVAGESF